MDRLINPPSGRSRVYRVLSWIGYVIWVNLIAFETAWADGFRSPLQDSAAIAQGNAFRAQADNPAAIYFNPAGMTQLTGIQQSFGVQFVNVSTEFRSFSGDRIGNDFGNIIGSPPPGQFLITGSLKSVNQPILRDITLGLGVLSLFGYASKFPENGPFSSVMTRSQLPLLNIKPTIAYKINERLSLGFGVDIFTFANFLEGGRSEQQSVAVGNIHGTTPGQKLEFNGSGTAVGYNLSLLWTPWMAVNRKPRVNVGFVWRSGAELPLVGELRADGQKVDDTKTTIRLPESYEWGVAIWPLRTTKYEWKVEVDVDYVRWSSTRNFDITFSSGEVLPNPQNWSDAITIGIGTEWKWIKPKARPNWDYMLRAGYLRSHNSIPDHNFNPAFPDSDLHSITLGMGFRCQEGGKFLWFIPCGNTEGGNLLPKAMALDLAYMALLLEPRTVVGHQNPGINGRYETIIHAGSLTFRMEF